MIKKPEKNDSRRVVITGLGVISSLGIGWQDFWKNLLAGKSGISKIESFDTSGYDRHYGGEVKNFDPSKFISKRKLPYMGRASQMAIAASKLALKDAALDLKSLSEEKIGICLGTTMGESQILEELNKDFIFNRMNKIDPSQITIYPANIISSNIAKEIGAGADNYVFSTACASGNYSIGYACDLIRFDANKRILCGGVDALSGIAFTGFCRLLSMAPEKCQPFDKNRKGMMLGEGAGILVLESLRNAKKRKANIYAEILGYGLSNDVESMTSPSPYGISKATERALRESKVDKLQVNYINMHGTGTLENDRAECLGLKKVFGNNLKKIPVSSIKSMLSHTLGASSALETIATSLMIKNGKVLPTINFEIKDPEIDIDCVPNRYREHKINIALNNSLAFGGNTACLVLKKY